tara:strand:- start:106 stop:429 length:324 start_codon:yes stop_codon:yes gene_type:complete
MKFINNAPKVKKPQKEFIYINKSGQEINNDVDKVYAKVLLDQKKETYFIVIYQNLPLDPLGTYQKRQAYLETKMKKVSKQTFDYYLTYLQTKNSIYFTRTNRSYNNG